LTEKGKYAIIKTINNGMNKRMFVCPTTLFENIYKLKYGGNEK